MHAKRCRCIVVTSFCLLAAWPVRPAAAQRTPASDARPIPADARQPDTERRRWWSPLLDRYEWLQGMGLQPGVKSIVAGSGVSFGVTYLEPRLVGPIGYTASAAWSVRGYSEYRLRAGLIDALTTSRELSPADANAASQFNDMFAMSPGLAMYVDVQSRSYPQGNFFGLGPDARAIDRSDFALEGLSADLVAQWQGDGHLGVSARAGVLDFTIGRGANADVPDLPVRFDETAIAGATTQTPYVTLGVGVVRDSRDSADVPTTGTFAGLSVWRYLALDPDRAPHLTRITFDGRAFVPVRATGVIAMRLLVSASHADDSRPAPFYLLHSLGGSKALRGHSNDELRDQALAQVSLEYRWRAVTMVEIAPFVDAGLVGPDLTAFSGSSVRVTPGVGVRVRTDKRLLFRVDVARRSDGYRVFLSLGSPF